MYERLALGIPYHPVPPEHTADVVYDLLRTIPTSLSSLRRVSSQIQARPTRSDAQACGERRSLDGGLLAIESKDLPRIPGQQKDSHALVDSQLSVADSTSRTV